MNANPETPPEAAEIPLLSVALLNLAGAQFLTGIWSVWDRCPNRGAARTARAIKIEQQGRDLRTENPDTLGSLFRNASATALLRSSDHVINSGDLSMEAGEYTTTGMRNMRKRWLFVGKLVALNFYHPYFCTHPLPLALGPQIAASFGDTLLVSVV